MDVSHYFKSSEVRCYTAMTLSPKKKFTRDWGHMLPFVCGSCLPLHSVCIDMGMPVESSSDKVYNNLKSRCLIWLVEEAGWIGKENVYSYIHLIFSSKTVMTAISIIYVFIYI